MALFGKNYFRKITKKPALLSKNFAPGKEHIEADLKEASAWGPFYAYKKSQFKHGFTLVIGRETSESLYVAHCLRNTNKPFLYIDFDEFFEKGEIFLSNKGAHFLKYKNQRISLKKVKSVFYTFPQLVEVYQNNFSDFKASEKLLLSRWMHYLMALEELLEAKWYPAKPSQLTFLSHIKLADLALAEKLQLQTPNYVLTNNYSEVKKRANGKYLLADHGIKLIDDGKKVSTFYTNFLKVSANDRKTIKYSPILIEKFMQKESDIRVVVIDKTVIAIEIAQQNAKGLGDWRQNLDKATFIQHELPKRIEQKLIRFQHDRGYRFSSFDLLLDRSGYYNFLEMNRPGSWLFIEALSGVNIGKTVARTLG